MSLKIGVVSQKGGVGKSTLSRAIATAYAAHDWDVKIADMDISQSTSYQWQKRRLVAGIQPVIAVECFATVSQVLKKASDYDLTIFDGAPHATLVTLDIARCSDMIIIPTGFSVDDMEPAVVLANDLTGHGVARDRIAFAFCRTGDSKAEYEDAHTYLGQTPYFILPAMMQEKTAFRRASDAGKSSTETPYKKPRMQAESLVQCIMDRINELTN